MPRCSLHECTALATAKCGACGGAWFCGKGQKVAWKRGHKLWCALINTVLPATGGGGVTVTFLGQSNEYFRELSQAREALAAAVSPRPGWAEVVPGGWIQIAAAAAGGKGGYYPLADKVDMGAIRGTWSSEAIVIPRRRCQLNLTYCVPTEPSFRLEARAGAQGFTTADLISATAIAYQWCYEREEAVAPRPPQMGFLLNRGQSDGARAPLPPRTPFRAASI